MARPAALLSAAVRHRDTVKRAEAHLVSARGEYRAACLKAVEGGVPVARLAEGAKTSWSRMDQLLKQAKAERKLKRGEG
jgi:hypothetical protein